MTGARKLMGRWSESARLPLGGIAALGIAAAAAFFFAMMPVELLERLVAGTGLPRLLPPARAPLGSTAHLLIVAAAALGAGAATWAAFRLLGVDGATRKRAPVRRRDPSGGRADAPALRRADAHPDAPPRRPIFAAADLGAPLDAEGAEPASWDEPVATPPPPTSWFAREPDAAPVLELADSVDADVEADVEADIEPIADPIAVAPATPESIPALMARLEAGLVRRGLAGGEPAAPDAPLARAIGALRREAARA